MRPILAAALCAMLVGCVVKASDLPGAVVLPAASAAPVVAVPVATAPPALSCAERWYSSGVPAQIERGEEADYLRRQADILKDPEIVTDRDRTLNLAIAKKYRDVMIESRTKDARVAWEAQNCK